jgi:hypothetical protein
MESKLILLCIETNRQFLEEFTPALLPVEREQGRDYSRASFLWLPCPFDNADNARIAIDLNRIPRLDD